MYEAHFGFHRQPFQSADACRAFFVSESIREILPQLLHALRSDLGIAVITGVPGSGKTSLLRHIQQQLANEGRVIVWSGANLGTSADLISALLQASRMTGGTETTTKQIAIDRATQGSRSSALDHMKRTAELWGPVLLLIDDVQLVPLPVLNELRACTEEEWNGRDLVRCLVSAPISFEDQLARQEYADFTRRIRCHAFLQPLKSSESILFLKDQIELAGGRISNVFTTPALESITAAAGGNPRCLGLLADETLVVAAMVGEKIASENSVRTALSRLQHLQYHWNSLPQVDIAETGESTPEPTEIETLSTELITSSNSSATPASTAPAAIRYNAPTQATIAPGVIEFGGPATSTKRPTAKPPSATAPQPASISQVSQAEDGFDDSGYVDVSGCVELPEHVVRGEQPNQNQDIPTTAASTASLENHILSAVNQTETRSTAVEFGSTNSRIEAGPTSIAPKVGNPIPEFEVGQRFVSESTQESISIDDTEDCDILELFNLGVELDFVNSASSSITSPAAPERGEVPEAKIMWFNGNANSDETLAPLATDLVNTSVNIDSTSLSMAEETPANAAPPAAESKRERAEFESDHVITRGKFFNVASANLSNRSPVFDRYTWLALGREVPAGRSSVVTVSATRQLIQADYSILPSGPLTTISSLSPNLQRVASIDQIPISTTTDAVLIQEIARNSLNAQSGVYLAISAVETSHDETQSADSLPISNSDTIEDLEDPNPTSASGLRIWQDGMLVFPNGESTEHFNSPDSDILSHESNSVERHAIEASTETSSTQSTTSDESSPDRNLLQLGAGGFFTLPEPKPQHADELNSLQIATDEDVYPFVEAINNMRADVRSFQDTGSVPAEDADPASRFSQTTDSANQSDNVVSRAKRRLDDRTNLADTKTLALQISPEVRSPQKTKPGVKTPPEAESVLTTDGMSNAESTLKFGSLFTRLRETRKRVADQAQADA